MELRMCNFGLPNNPCCEFLQLISQCRSPKFNRWHHTVPQRKSYNTAADSKDGAACVLHCLRLRTVILEQYFVTLGCCFYGFISWLSWFLSSLSIKNHLPLQISTLRDQRYSNHVFNKWPQYKQRNMEFTQQDDDGASVRQRLWGLCPLDLRNRKSQLQWYQQC